MKCCLCGQDKTTDDGWRTAHGGRVEVCPTCVERLPRSRDLQDKLFDCKPMMEVEV